jgi:hypothetical protein
VRALTAIWAAATAAATASMPAVLVMPHIAEPIHCDGELDEPAWKTPARTGPFSDRTGAQAAPYSEARFMVDDKRLYLALYAADEDIRSSDEFVIDVGAGGQKTSWHFRADGSLQPKIAGAQVAVDVDGSVNDPSNDDEEWVIEAAIPLAAVPFHKDGTVELQVARCDTTKDHVKRCGSWKGTLARR